MTETAALRQGRPGAVLRAALLGLLLAGPAGARGEAAPDFALAAAGGANLRLSEYRGNPVVLAFWASWCPDCRPLLARLARLPRAGPVPAEDGLRVFAVSIDHDTTAAGEVAGGLGLDYPVLLDVKRAVVKAYEVETIPAVILIDRSGMIRHRVSGAEAIAALDLAGEIEALAP